MIKIICKQNNRILTSHHDALLSSFHSSQIKDWTDEGILEYSRNVAPQLDRLRQSWMNPLSTISTEVLLHATNNLLVTYAKNTNEFSDFSIPFKKSPKRKPVILTKSEAALRRSHNLLRKIDKSSPSYFRFARAHNEKKRQYTRLIRFSRMRESMRRDHTLNKIISSDPSTSYKSIRKLRSSCNSKINKLSVGQRLYSGEMVPDGIYESIQLLKTEPVIFQRSEDLPDFSEEYLHILDICRAGSRIPPISEEKAASLLRSMKKNVTDIYNITVLHFLNAGEAGIAHFCSILNTIIENVSNAGLQELNSIYARVLHKGHGKDRECSRSYRTIFICPVVTKALDMYLRELSVDSWNLARAETQYQGENMSHELASVLLTETLQYASNVSKEPVYALFLDAKSAFDRVIKEILLRNMFIAGTTGHNLLYFDQRLSNRKTYCHYNNALM